MFACYLLNISEADEAVMENVSRLNINVSLSVCLLLGAMIC